MLDFLTTALVLNNEGCKQSEASLLNMNESKARIVLGLLKEEWFNDEPLV